MTIRELGGVFYVSSLTMWAFLIVYTPLAIFGVVPWTGILVYLGTVSVMLLASICSWLRTFHTELGDIRLETDDVARCDIDANQHAAEE